MLTIPHEEIGPEGTIIHFPVRDALMQEFVDFLFKTKRWQHDQEYLVRWFRKRRNEMIEEGRAELRRLATLPPGAGKAPRIRPSRARKVNAAV